MKVVLVHGENSGDSRKRFVQIVQGVKKKGWEVSYITPDSLAPSLKNRTIFGGETLFVVEEITKLSREIEWVGKNKDKIESQLLLYSKTKVPAKVIKLLGKDVKIEEFSYPKLLFAFLDSLAPGNAKQATVLLNELLVREPLELVVAMMGRVFRDLYWVFAGGEGMSYPPWRLSKLGAQAKKFTNGELVSIIETLAEVDFKSKTSDFDARLALELLIIEKLG